MDTATVVTLGLLFALIPAAIIGITASALMAGKPMKPPAQPAAAEHAEERLAA